MPCAAHQNPTFQALRFCSRGRGRKRIGQWFARDRHVTCSLIASLLSGSIKRVSDQKVMIVDPFQRTAIHVVIPAPEVFIRDPPSAASFLQGHLCCRAVAQSAVTEEGEPATGRRNELVMFAWWIAAKGTAKRKDHCEAGKQYQCGEACETHQRSSPSPGCPRRSKEGQGDDEQNSVGGPDQIRWETVHEDQEVHIRLRNRILEDHRSRTTVFSATLRPQFPQTRLCGSA
ncbi:hypothetical protein Terro_3814 [Terriglobus roseus DSM 18391]|uniref:Uncharacterized protein n=1 Tax=Terriglobus roseus (strain DSM 18391 / NRRL B-41598 / KBS 63) TaxID=926566 RepID=I3ZLA5_TERRK|nr:hypothetical protein Terro_3814 [Terriglobus roseus DSM 18391]